MASEQRPAAPPASAAPTSAPARDSLLAFADFGFGPPRRASRCGRGAALRDLLPAP